MKNKISNGMKKIIKISLLSFLTLCFFNTAYATLNIEIDVNVPNNCTVADIDGVMHNYPQMDSSNSYLAICALSRAIENNSISSTQLSNQFPSMGLFITAINDVVADPNSQYWAIYQNGNMANLGITSLPVLAGDIIVFKLNDFSDISTGDQITLHINSLGNPPKPTSGGGSRRISDTVPLIPIIKPTFDIKKAYDFLIKEQKEDGSFGEKLYTDWVAVSLGANNDYENQKNKLKKHLLTIDTNDFQLTDYERYSISLMSLGINPHDINGKNIIKKILDNYDGKQFGDNEAINDDIFALIVLQNVGYTGNDNIVKNTVSHIISEQKDDGSWENSVDMTGASIQVIMNIAQKNCFLLGSLSGVATPALPLGSTACETPQNKEFFSAMKKAKEFLKQKQKDDGSFGNVSSTAWAIGGIIALGEKPEDWIKNTNSPIDYLTTKQDTDGGIKNENKDNKIWETAYVLTSLSEKTWNQIMQKFPTPSLASDEVITLNNKPETNIIKQEIKKISEIKKMLVEIKENTENNLQEVKKENKFKNFFNKILEFFF